MSPVSTLSVLAIYFLVLFAISYFTSRNHKEDSFYTGDKQSPWFIVAFGMIGASLSGVTFISIPGTVAKDSFGYMQMVFGYFIGYMVIAFVLMPLYYKLNLTSIYSYLGDRYGRKAQLTGASFFLLSRIIGASLRMFLVVIVLQRFIFDPLNIHYSITIFLSLALIWLYTFKSGIKTIVWTDSLQTFFMLLSLFIAIALIGKSFDWSFTETISQAASSQFSQVFFFDDFLSKGHFVKQFIGGAIIAIAMTGLDQDMMQKNLSCKSLKDAQKNMIWFSVILIVVNFIFLCLGALLFIYMNENNIPMPTRLVGGELKEAGDLLFPTLAIEHLGSFCAIIFIIGLIAAAYSSADSALTSLTTSFCIDFLKLDNSPSSVSTRRKVHLGFTALCFVVIMVFYNTNDTSTIYKLFKWAGFTYGPLVGLFFFGLWNKRKVLDEITPYLCLLSPVLCFLLDTFSQELFAGYQFGFELLLLNGIVTYILLLTVSKPTNPDLN